MRVFSKSRERLLATVAATIMTAAAAHAQSPDTAQQSGAANLAIEAAVPMPEPANVPPPTAADLNPAPAAEAKPADTTATLPDTKTPDTKTPETKAVEAAPAPANETAPVQTTATPPATQPAVAAVPEADIATADRLRDILTAKTSRYFDRKGEKAAVEAFYTARQFAPLWSAESGATQRAKDAIARLQKSDADGLDADEYRAPDFAAATTPDARADAELKFAATLLDYARHSASGRIHYSRISADIMYPDHSPDADEVLKSLAEASNVAAALDAFSPPHQGYKALKAKLAELRGSTENPLAPIAEGPTLKVVNKTPMKDDRVPVLRARLGVTENLDDTTFDRTVSQAVRKFQASAGIAVTGTLNEATVRALNAPKRDKQIDTVLVNMERWRWIPRELGEPKLDGAYVVLNIPEYTLRVHQHDKVAWTTRVVVGLPSKATPEMTETMKYITVNPTWNVPPSIIYNEYLPALQQDPTVLDRMGLKLTQNRDGSVHISQPPGERNALGRIRFNFPNKYLVYQHDTPDKHLFAKEDRAYSHGCMRVQNPDQYAEVLLGIANPADKYSAARIRGMYGRSEQNINLTTPIPVHIVYQTAFVDEHGKLDIRKDVYGRDARMIALMKGSDRKVADVAVERAQPNYSRPPVRVPAGVAYAGNGYGSGYAYNSGPSFLERLFGAPEPAAPPPRPARRVYAR